MITTSGSAAVGNLLANSLGGYIAVGVGSNAPTVNDERLAFETYRVPIRSRSYDPTTKVVTFTATIPDSVEFYLAEAALVDSPLDAPGGGFVVMFDPSFEEWSAGSWESENSRVGTGVLSISAETATAIGGTRVGLASSGLSDLVQVAYHGNGGSVEVRLMSSDADYYSMNFSAGTGYNVATSPIHAMTKTGNPDVSSVSGVSVIHSGSGSVLMDAIRVTPVEEGEGVILRQTFEPGYRKIAGMPLDIEVPLQL